MIELQFDKGICEYEVQIQQITKANDTLPMKLDSGSPITIICIPYLATDITIGEQNLNYFLFWLDVTNYTKYEITTTLFGYDYIKQGKKWFDDSDNFYIKFENNIQVDLQGIKGALNNYNEKISDIGEIKELWRKDNIRKNNKLRNFKEINQMIL